MSAGLVAPVALAFVNHVIGVLLNVAAERAPLANYFGEAATRVTPDVALMSARVYQLSFSNRFASHCVLQL